VRAASIEEAQAQAVKEVVAWQLAKAMKPAQGQLDRPAARKPPSAPPPCPLYLKSAPLCGRLLQENHKIPKNKMAALLKTSRTQVDRLLDPKIDITLSNLQRAAAIVGRRVTIELV